jgi:SAM-dependent methyltransferase
MHNSSFTKARIFVEQYRPEMPVGKPIQVLEIGSKSYHEQDTYRSLFPSPEFAYTGLDIEPGTNVDIVPRNPFIWDEVQDSTFDVCISGQTFEHNPYYWITFAEIARVLKPGGLALIIAPGAGPVHRYPLDCWRFYPDSWAALCALTGVELVESYFETDTMAATVPGGAWRDSAAIARKPALEGAALSSFHDRLRKLVQLFRDEPMSVQQGALPQGKWATAYASEMSRTFPMTLSKSIQLKIRKPKRIHSHTDE